MDIPLSANGLDDGSLGQVGRVGGWWVRVVGWLADVIDVEVVTGFAAVGSGLGEWVFDSVRADGVRILAVGVGAGCVALGESWGAVVGVGIHQARVLVSGDEGLVGIVKSKVNISFLLEGSVEPAVVDAQSDELDVLAFDAAGGDGGVLLVDVVGEFGAVVAAVGLGEDAEVAVLVLGELGVEGLEKGPDVGSGGDGGGDGVVAVGEADTDGLVDVQLLRLACMLERRLIGGYVPCSHNC